MRWFWVALLPAAFTPHPNYLSDESTATPESSAGLLVLGRYREYQRLVQRDAAPSVASTDQPAGDQWAITQAIGWSLLQGTQGEGATALRRISRDNSFSQDARTAAAIYAAVAFADLDDVDEAISVLQDRLESRNDLHDAQAAWLLLALTLRLCDRESWTSARAVLAEAKGLLDGLLDSSPPPLGLKVAHGEVKSEEELWPLLLGGLVDTVKLNLLALSEGRPGLDSMVAFFGRIKPQYWVRFEDGLRRGLEEAQERVFLSAIRDAHTGVRHESLFGTAGHDDELFRSYLMAEIVGDWQRSIHIREVLGRQRVLTRDASDKVWASREGVRLLRRARKHQAVSQFADTLQNAGPLVVLKDEGQRALRRAERSLNQSDLSIIRASAAVFSRDDCRRALAVLLRHLSVPVVVAPGGAWWRTADPLWRTIGDLVSQVPDSPDVEAAARVAAAAEDPAVVQRLAAVLPRLKWDDAQARQWWSEWAAVRLDGDAQFVAVDLAPAFARYGDMGLTEALRRRCVEAPSALLMGGILEADAVADRVETVPSAWVNRLEQDLNRTVEDARRGAFGFGGADVPAIAVSVQLRAADPGLGSAIETLLQEPSVAGQDKSGAFAVLAQSVDQAPVDILEAAVSGARDMLTQAEDRFPFSGGGKADALRFLLRVQRLPEDAALQLLNQLAGSSEWTDRYGAALALGEGVEVIDAGAATVLLSRLSSDRSSIVCGAAARGLGTYVNAVSRSALAAELVRLLRRALMEDGIAVPRGAVLGVLRGGPNVAALISSELQALQNHMAWEVRQLASRALGLA